VLAEIGSTPLPPTSNVPAAFRTKIVNDIKLSTQNIVARSLRHCRLHFTPEVLAESREIASLAEVTLHVGYGTFEPVRVDDVAQHSVSSEHFEISETAAQTINDARASGRIIVVGTTTMRALESSQPKTARVAGRGVASLTIKPGYRFAIADALLTNFHLPRSSLLILVSAFAGRELCCAPIVTRSRALSFLQLRGLHVNPVGI
jgi:S-adenosylmethionine:tRNA ribosyltransferase-isomerase